MVCRAAQSQGAEHAARHRELRVLRVVGLAVFGLIAFSTLVDYLVGLQIDGANEKRAKKAWLGVSLLVNLGLLCYFKYSNCFFNTDSRVLRPNSK